MTKKSANRKDIARLVSRETGFTMQDIEEVMEAEDWVVASLISEGIEIKNHKLYKLELETKPEKRAYDGLNKRYFTIPEKQVLKFRPLSQLTNALDELNQTDKDDEEEK